ncbi:MAG: hypothetical protein R2877_00880 [Bdellovibrionota bacterium]
MLENRVIDQYGKTFSANSAHPYTHALLNGIPRLDQPHNKLAPIPGLPPGIFRISQWLPLQSKVRKSRSLQGRCFRRM